MASPLLLVATVVLDKRPLPDVEKDIVSPGTRLPFSSATTAKTDALAPGAIDVGATLSVITLASAGTKSKAEVALYPAADAVTVTEPAIVPARKTTCATPSELVIELLAERLPADAEKLTISPLTAAPSVSVTVARNATVDAPSATRLSAPVVSSRLPASTALALIVRSAVANNPPAVWPRSVSTPELEPAV